MNWKFIFKLTLRLELYTNLIVVSLAVYFISFAGGYSQNEVIYVIISSSIAAVVAMGGGIAFRALKLSDLLGKIGTENCDYSASKLELLSFPRFEGISICFRWVLGVALAYLILISFFIEPNLIETVPFFLVPLFCLPTNFVINYFTTENMLSQYLMKAEIRAAHISDGSYKLFGAFKRTLVIVVSILTIPFIILSRFIYLTNFQILQFTDFVFHIAFVFALSLAVIVVAVYESTAGMRTELDITLRALKTMVQGNLHTDPIPMLTSGEIGRIGQSVNILAATLRNSQDLFAVAFNSSPAGIAVIDQNNERFININKSFIRITGFDRDEIVGKPFLEIGLFASTEENIWFFNALKRDAHLRDYDAELNTRSEDIRFVTISADIIELMNKPHIIVTIEDITEKKILEKEIMNISERERLNIGQDLHDDLGPHLAAIDVISKILSQKIENEKITVPVEIKKIRAMIQEGIVKTRRLARGLCPVYSTDLGLESSLKELVISTESLYGISCNLEFADSVIFHDAGITRHLYQIIQEAVHNSAKHAQPQNISIRLFRDKNHIGFSIEDNGVGIQQTEKSKGMGLRIMSHRAKMINALLEIENGEKKGTIVKIFFRNRDAVLREKDDT